ncbi:hypothetical protein [Streptomyces sediminimaris]|uniref:hypothetical protein n=1 Tax=Streptomyces sediminimaris TaxID=3383721 RepID=UPI00399B5D59
MSAPAQSRIPTPGDLARRQTGIASPTAEPAPSPAAPETQAPEPQAPPAEEARPVCHRPMYEPRPLTAEEAIAPGVLMDTEFFRTVFRYCLTRSGLPPHARLIAHELLARANDKNGRLGPKQPFLDQLAHATGLTEAQTGVALQVLYTRGWIAYRPACPDDRQPLYDLVIPALELERARGRRYLHQEP